MGGGAGGGCAAPAAAAELLPAGSVYINSLWQLEEEEGLAAQPPDQQGRHSPLRHQLKSLASAASAADGAHLIARSSSGRSGDLKMRAGNSWREELAKVGWLRAALFELPHVPACLPAARHVVMAATPMVHQLQHLSCPTTAAGGSIAGQQPPDRGCAADRCHCA